MGIVEVIVSIIGTFVSSLLFIENITLIELALLTVTGTLMRFSLDTELTMLFVTLLLVLESEATSDLDSFGISFATLSVSHLEQHLDDDEQQLEEPQLEEESQQLDEGEQLLDELQHEEDEQQLDELQHEDEQPVARPAHISPATATKKSTKTTRLNS